MEVGYLAAFAGGMLALLSPCGALLLPSFFAIAFERPGVLLRRSGAFLIGTLLVMVPLGFAAASVGWFLAVHREQLITGAGWVLIVLGLVTATGLVRRLPLGGGRLMAGASSRLGARGSEGPSSLAVAGLGAVYGIAGSCTGPILGAVLTIAAVQGRPSYGAALLAVYAVGMVVPLVLLVLAWERVPGLRERLRRGGRWNAGPFELQATSLIAGGMFLAIGVWFVASGGLPSLPGVDTFALDQTLQSWSLRLDRAVGDGWLLALVGIGAAVVLVVRLRRS